MSSADLCRTSHRTPSRNSRSRRTGSPRSSAGQRSSIINVVTRSGGETTRGSAAIYLRDQSWQALPDTIDPALDRRSAVRSPAAIVHDRRSAARPAPVRVCRRRSPQSGRRRTGGRPRSGVTNDRPHLCRRATRRSPRHGRLDWRPTSNDGITVRYSYQHEDDTAASSLDRAIGSASQRQAVEQPHAQRAGIVDSRDLASRGQRSERQLQCLRQRDFARRTRRPVDLSELPGRIVVPGAAGHAAEALAILRCPVAESRNPPVETRRSAAASRLRFRARRVPGRSH